MPRIKWIHPDEACAILGLVPSPGEGKWAPYNRRRHLKELGLQGKPMKKVNGYRYREDEVKAKARELGIAA